MPECVLDGCDDFECALGSNLPDDLRGLGHHVNEIGDGERILPN
jgi:hypothetical protein